MQRFVENIEKTITNTPGILSSNIQKQFGPDSETVYLKGNFIFIDSSVLEIAIFANNILQFRHWTSDFRHQTFICKKSTFLSLMSDVYGLLSELQNNILDTVAIDKYRFHYMGKNGQMIFRYDNAPHLKFDSWMRR